MAFVAEVEGQLAGFGTAALWDTNDVSPEVGGGSFSGGGATLSGCFLLRTASTHGRDSSDPSLLNGALPYSIVNPTASIYPMPIQFSSFQFSGGFPATKPAPVTFRKLAIRAGLGTPC